MVVDDEAMQRGLIRDTLETLRTSAEHFDVIEAGNSSEAMDILQQQTVDAVLLDKRMPVMDGDQLCMNIRSKLGLRLLPIIMVTGTNASEELARSFAAGATDFIHKPYSPTELLARLKGSLTTKRLTDQLDTAENLLFALARTVEAKDATTGDHCSRLMHLGMVFGRALGLDERELDALRRGSILHDIGKLCIPDSILLKGEVLTDEEWALMRTHAVIGGHLCAGLNSMRDVMPIIVHHHERWDGSGYPDGLAGAAIPFLARVFQILDIYDALSSERPYKEAMNTEQIIAVFEEETALGWRDPVLVQAFLELLRNYPEQFSIPDEFQQTEDQRIFQSIAATGVINWELDKKRHEPGRACR